MLLPYNLGGYWRPSVTWIGGNCPYASVSRLSQVLVRYVLSPVALWTNLMTSLRRLRVATTALASALCIVLSLSFYEHYDPKSDLCVLIAVPGLCLVVSVTAYASQPSLSVDLIFRFTHHGQIPLEKNLNKVFSPSSCSVPLSQRPSPRNVSGPHAS